jgi:predicted MPP superfamily phosphohydrolase
VSPRERGNILKEQLRRIVLEKLIFNLALLLGLAQFALGTWAWSVVAQRPPLGGVLGVVAIFVLVGANSFVVPALRRARVAAGRRAWFARLYTETGVATLLVASALGVVWLAWFVVGPIADAVGLDLSFRGVSSVVVGAAALAVLWGFTIGQSRVAHTRLRFELPGLHDDLRGLRIVQLSDLHIGNRLEGDRLERMVERANRLEPDLIVLTGDIFDFDRAHVPDGARRLSKLRARHGVYAVLGNHDAAAGADFVASALERWSPELRLLRDEIVAVPVGRPLYLAGVEDPGREWSRRDVELAGLDAVAAARRDDGPTVLLVHRPEAFAQAERHGFPLVLAGHTHGGQIALPGSAGQLNLARVMTRFTRGTYRRGGTTLYVNRGIGVAGPAIRIGCTREITTIELHPA